MKSCRITLLRLVAITLAMTFVMVGSARAQTTYGTLSNFDVFNDTGKECHGFEIELDGIAKADVTYTFGSTYQRYGDPTVEEFAGGVYVRYASQYDAGNQRFLQTTPMAPAVITPTDGHACWSNGSPNYLTSGCEHFGVGITKNPTNTVYRWLIADPTTPGALQPSGTKVSIPAPVWTVAPGPNPVVQAVLPAEPKEVNQLYGDAHWVKVFVTESETEIELHHLVTDDPVVPQEQSETEIEWVLLQDGPPDKVNNELHNDKQVGGNIKSVTRRYEFYEYTGAYDAEHEAVCGGGGGNGGGGRGNGGCDVPLPNEIGNYIGAQMAAVNLELIDLPTATVTPTETTTPTPTTTLEACVGNCDGNASVSVSELITLVNIALEKNTADACPHGIPVGTKVDISFLVRAVNSALKGCTP